MKAKFTTLLILLFSIININAKAQTFDVDTIQFSGDANKFINIVILGDGYINTEQNKFISDVNNLRTYLFTQPPFKNYKNYFNVFAVKVISLETGAMHPNTASDCNTANVPTSNPNTYLGCTFDYFGIHRLIVPLKNSAISNVLSTNFPNYDQVVILSNSPYYGGSGGQFATATNGPSSFEVMTHEIGHSFAGLNDEYYAGNSFAREEENMTQQTNPLLVKWKNWMGSNGIGIYAHCCGGNSALWNKPHNNCKMQFLNSPFCRVCSQTIIESIHDLTSPVVEFSPSNSSTLNTPNQFLDFKLEKLMKPIPNTLNIEWGLDGLLFSKNVDSIKIDRSTLTLGIHNVDVLVIDTTQLLRVDAHDAKHFKYINWTVNRTTSGINLTSKENDISYSVFPNPVSEVINISLEVKKRSMISIEIINYEGKVIQNIISNLSLEGAYKNSFNLGELTKGNYLVQLKIDGKIYTEKLIKQ